jgi:hypothetical protein
VRRLGKSRPGDADDARERSSATKEIPRELRGRRVLTRLAALSSELRETGAEPTTLHLTAGDEAAMRESAGDTFGPAGGEAAMASQAAWRAFFENWMRVTTKLVVVFDEPETRVS